MRRLAAIAMTLFAMPILVLFGAIFVCEVAAAVYRVTRREGLRAALAAPSGRFIDAAGYGPFSR